ncbi:monocarboxylate transporter 4-like isoform X1 [Mytilus galloprovincialis]|uniref:monocarboxylate transporter 4-like isoform X1 n=2 Tax=Mytilus galloprovincialis TaxID=29158 RepID=UPI003F7C4B14
MRKGEVDGCWGWMIVAAAALNRIVIYGISYSAGVVYVVILEVFNEGSGITSWISSLITAVLFFTCPLSGYLIERFGERKVAIAGSLIAGIGMTSSAFVNSVPALLLTYGIISGIGCGIAFMPGSVAVAKYFKKHRNLAMAIASAGGGVGSFAFPPIIEMLNEYYTWRGMFLILGGVTLNICVFGSLMRPLRHDISPEQKSQESGYSSDKSEYSKLQKSNVSKNLKTVPLNGESENFERVGFLDKHFYLKIPSFYILIINNFMYQFGASIILGHLQAYAVFQQGFTKPNAAILYTISGVMVLVFKLLHGVFANMSHVKLFRPIYQYIFFYALGGIATICLIINSRYGVYFYSAVFGMSYAACGGSLIPALIIDISGVETFGVTYGIVLLGLAFGQLTGAPVAGLLYEHQKTYDTAFILAGSMMIASALIMIYPLKTDLNPSKLNKQIKNNIEIHIEEIDSINDEVLTVFDPISMSVVKGSRTSLHSGNIDNLHSAGNFYHSSYGLHRINRLSDSLETIEVGPRSSSFSVHRHIARPHSGNTQQPSRLLNALRQEGQPHYHPILSPLAIER